MIKKTSVAEPDAAEKVRQIIEGNARLGKNWQLIELGECGFKPSFEYLARVEDNQERYRLMHTLAHYYHYMWDYRDSRPVSEDALNYLYALLIVYSEYEKGREHPAARMLYHLGGDERYFVVLTGEQIGAIGTGEKVLLTRTTEQTAKMPTVERHRILAKALAAAQKVCDRPLDKEERALAKRYVRTQHEHEDKLLEELWTDDQKFAAEAEKILTNQHTPTDQFIREYREQLARNPAHPGNARAKRAIPKRIRCLYDSDPIFQKVLAYLADEEPAVRSIVAAGFLLKLKTENFIYRESAKEILAIAFGKDGPLRKQVRAGIEKSEFRVLASFFDLNWKNETEFEQFKELAEKMLSGLFNFSFASIDRLIELANRHRISLDDGAVYTVEKMMITLIIRSNKQPGTIELNEINLGRLRGQFLKFLEEYCSIDPEVEDVRKKLMAYYVTIAEAQKKHARPMEEYPEQLKRFKKPERAPGNGLFRLARATR